MYIFLFRMWVVTVRALNPHPYWCWFSTLRKWQPENSRSDANRPLAQKSPGPCGTTSVTGACWDTEGVLHSLRLLVNNCRWSGSQKNGWTQDNKNWYPWNYTMMVDLGVFVFFKHTMIINHKWWHMMAPMKQQYRDVIHLWESCKKHQQSQMGICCFIMFHQE